MYNKKKKKKKKRGNLGLEVLKLNDAFYIRQGSIN